MKIAAKLTFAFLTVALFVMVVGFFSAHRSEKILQDTIGKNTALIAQETIDKIDRLIYWKAEEISLYFEDNFLKEIIEESNKKFDGMENAQGYIEARDKEWRQANKEAVTPFMQEIIDRPLSRNLRTVMKAQNELYVYPVFGEIFVTNRYGVNIAQTGKTSDYYQADEGWWTNAKNNALEIGDVEYDESSGTNSITIAVRIHDEKGDFLGVAKAVFDIRGIIEIIEEVKGNQPFSTAKIELLTDDGELVFETREISLTEKHSHDVDLIFEHEKDKAHRMWKLEKGPNKESTLRAHAHSQGYRNFKGLSWILLMEYRGEELLAPIEQLRKTLFAISLVTALLAILMGFLVSRSISDPITKLKDVAVKIGRGELDTEIELSGKGEIGELAESFRQMTRDLKQSTISKEYLDSIIENITDLLIVMDSHGVIMTVNKAACVHLGYSKDELNGKNASILFSEGEKDLEVLFRGISLEKFVGGQSLINYEVNQITKDGTQVPVLLSSAIMYDEKEGKTRIVCIAKDITEQKKAAELTNKVNKELRTNEKALKNMMYDMKRTNEELKNTQAQLVQSEKLSSLGQLSAGIAHEINNPLGFISNNIEMLEQYISSYTEILRATDLLKKAVQDKDLDKAVSLVKEISDLEEKVNLSFITSDIDNLMRQSKSGTERIKKIVQDLRTFARKDEGQMELSNVEEILDGVINIVWNEIKYKAELKKEYGGIPLVKCNSQKLGQVFINLLVNAAQAISENGEITVKTYCEEKHACIEVSDTGSGIKQEDINKIFDPFFTTKEVGKGTGLGLSIGYDIVKQHKGEMIVESKVGQGTKFIIKLPI